MELDKGPSDSPLENNQELAKSRGPEDQVCSLSPGL